MAAKELEEAQKALRSVDYDSLSDDDEEEDDRSGVNPFSGSNSAASVIRQRVRPTVTNNLHPLANSFDPYAPTPSADTTSWNSVTPKTEQNPIRDTSLFDDISVDMNEKSGEGISSLVPGVAGYLEMEEEPPRHIAPDPVDISEEPIKTSSGLLLTHRRSPTNSKNIPLQRDRSHPHNFGSAFRNVQKDYFEVENGYFSWMPNPSVGKHSMAMVQARRLLSYVKIWMVVSAVALIFTTGVFFHAFGHSNEDASAKDFAVEETNLSNQDLLIDSNGYMNQIPAQILLLPMENIAQVSKTKQKEGAQRRRLSNHHKEEEHGVRHLMYSLRQEFEEWTVKHGKQYHSEQEKEHRFNVWSQNHHRTIEKNNKHGPCKLTKQPVFGSNHFKDLTPEEFKSQYLTGYNGPRTDELEKAPGLRKLNQHVGQVLNPRIHKPKIHDSLKQRLLEENQQPAATYYTRRGPHCRWYDISCMLRWLWQAAGIQFGVIIGTMEPKFDKNAYPNSVDWRELGAVTDVRAQGNCGACWAITAVETVESAHFLATGNLYDLSEAEIITCDESCEMCSGGWPQNAFKWVMDHGGLPLYNTFPYDATTLLSMTSGLEGESEYWTQDSIKEYRQQVCPASDDKKDSKDDSHDSYWADEGVENGNYADYTDQGRYGNIKGYGYATDRCICYSDGSGCDCDNQDEDLAIGNVATYGPAVVCLEASLWQDYYGGVISSDSGCGSKFLDVNHCVQVVGYAYTFASDDDEDERDDGEDREEERHGSHDESSSRKSGYWIVRNQWGNSWGMQGYAYVAMGANTCGILNDMTQAYL